MINSSEDLNAYLEFLYDERADLTKISNYYNSSGESEDRKYCDGENDESLVETSFYCDDQSEMFYFDGGLDDFMHSYGGDVNGEQAMVSMPFHNKLSQFACSKHICSNEFKYKEPRRIAPGGANCSPGPYCKSDSDCKMMTGKYPINGTDWGMDFEYAVPAAAPTRSNYSAFGINLKLRSIVNLSLFSCFS